MGTRNKAADIAVAINALHASGVRFVLTADPARGFEWYLPNPAEEYDPEDWVFHALERGTADNLVDAVTDLTTAAVVRSRKQTARRAG